MLVGKKVELAAWQMIPERMEQAGLTWEDGMAKAWYVGYDAQGKVVRVTGGAEAINDTLRHVWYIWPFTYLYYVPGMRQLQNRVYQWIADNRYKLPGSTAACAVNLPQSGEQ